MSRDVVVPEFHWTRVICVVSRQCLTVEKVQNMYNVHTFMMMANQVTITPRATPLKSHGCADRAHVTRHTDYIYPLFKLSLGWELALILRSKDFSSKSSPRGHHSAFPLATTIHCCVQVEQRLPRCQALAQDKVGNEVHSAIIDFTGLWANLALSDSCRSG